MENFFEMNLEEKQVTAFSNLSLAHIGDGVYELMCRSYLCSQGPNNVGQLHKDTVQLVKATTQARLVEKILPMLTEAELAFYRRGKNAHVHAVPKATTPADYAKATGLEALFGALYLMGQRNRINELFRCMMEV